MDNPDLNMFSNGVIVLDGGPDLRGFVLLVSEGESQRMVGLTFQTIRTIDQAIFVVRRYGKLFLNRDLMEGHQILSDRQSH